ncbi:lipopolysaccharide assembly protein LapA domain-containing protein [Croceicoccus naphthovorans]|uniref:Uncharacterized protein n=1 Tax=Croceicoccus naphthovorans TaxID=1348774 RepID=A0A0G3XEP9_9SPHN|nr:LapA family protein [Croceicoccus naphthovorans]AKM09672.1 hypothetical protein AB433_06245 [Croceicoccus naphthovorans]MBB3990797.1 putative integral membrane protein [Croceicoccus naphthovorans]
MQIVKTVVWAVIVAGLAVFAYANWFRVEVAIWSGLELETPLPVLILTSFLLGLLPMWLFHRAARWRLKRRITSLEAAQASLVAAREEEQHTFVRDSEKPQPL